MNETRKSARIKNREATSMKINNIRECSVALERCSSTYVTTKTSSSCLKTMDKIYLEKDYMAEKNREKADNIFTTNNSNVFNEQCSANDLSLNNSMFEDYFHSTPNKKKRSNIKILLDDSIASNSERIFNTIDLTAVSPTYKYLSREVAGKTDFLAGLSVFSPVCEMKKKDVDKIIFNMKKTCSGIKKNQISRECKDVSGKKNISNFELKYAKPGGYSCFKEIKFPFNVDGDDQGNLTAINDEYF